jgi:hypothetical protein
VSIASGPGWLRWDGTNALRSVGAASQWQAGRSGGIGRRASLRGWCPQGRGGSSPPSDTHLKQDKRVTSLRVALSPEGAVDAAFISEIQRGAISTTLAPECVPVASLDATGGRTPRSPDGDMRSRSRTCRNCTFVGFRGKCHLLLARWFWRDADRPTRLDLGRHGQRTSRARG